MPHLAFQQLGPIETLVMMDDAATEVAGPGESREVSPAVEDVLGLRRRVSSRLEQVELESPESVAATVLYFPTGPSQPAVPIGPLSYHL